MSKKTTNPKTYHPTRVLSFSSEVQDSHRVMPLASHSPVNKSMNESTSDSSVKQLDHHEEGQALLERSRRPTQPPGALESMMNHNHNHNHSLMETTPPRKFDMLSFQKEESSLNSNQSHMNNNNNDVVSSISLTNTFNVFGHHNSSSRNHIHGSPLSSMGGVYEMNNNNANFVGYMNSNTSPSNPQHLSGASSLAGFYGLSHLSSNQQNNHNNNNTNPIDPNDSPPNPQEDDTVNLGSVNNSFDHTNNLYCYSVTSSLLDNSGRTYLSSTYKLCSSMASSLSSQQELSLHPVNSNTSNGDLCGGPSPAVPSLPGESSNNTNCFYRLGKRGKVPKYVRFLVKHRHARKQNGVSN
ncbi:hypothetical protein ADEAN_000815500 [Angomonas deanei]|uniref:Uncharacterized protein n=1 Tax=Angomonas deanei TaxID=59799 RepID=A0A7G2CQ14_9TRYP|nr:hypothetical protein ADEAN_000815500 [Angomonas deanei]